MNVELLRKVRDAILAHPERVNMNTWCRGAASGEERLPRTLADYGEEQLPRTLLDPDCNTVGCIAGWTCAIAGVDARGINARVTAEKLLNPPSDHVHKLFYTNNWRPEWLLKLYYAQRDDELYARVVADYIDYFIETYGEENKQNEC